MLYIKFMLHNSGEQEKNLHKIVYRWVVIYIAYDSYDF